MNKSMDGSAGLHTEEVPVVFECEGDHLVGMVHRPEQLRGRGLLIVVAGGPQYRVGVGRMQLTLARHLASQGIPVMRFDHRGVGDSEGMFRDFEDIEADLRSAIAAFKSAVPGLQHIELWGGCNAASAVMMNGWKFPEVAGMVISNPWVHDPLTTDTVVVTHHFRQRMFEWSFWKKVLLLKYNPLPAAVVLLRSVWDLASRPARRLAQRESAVDERAQHFIVRMRKGMARFKGDVLLLMSGRSMVSKEFDALVQGSSIWQEAMRAPRRVHRHDMPNADQTHSTDASRQELAAIASWWLRHSSDTAPSV